MNISQYKAYASDVIVAAQLLAQVKSLNSFSFRDLTDTLNEFYGYTYERVAQIDTGYYSKVIKISSELTHLPPYVKNTVDVFYAPELHGYNRKKFRKASKNDLRSADTYYLSGMDLHVKAALYNQNIWCEYVPEAPLLFFTMNNRDPQILDNEPPVTPFEYNYGAYHLVTDIEDINEPEGRIIYNLRHDTTVEFDLTDKLRKEGYDIVSYIHDYPYVFVTYHDNVVDTYVSVVYKNVVTDISESIYNAFDYAGRPTNVKFLDAHYNDYTGMYVIVKDYNDHEHIKKLGFTCDTLVDYPSRIIYNFIVAHMAKRFADLNSSTIQAVESALITSERQLAQFLKRDQGGWNRIEDVQKHNISEWL